MALAVSSFDAMSAYSRVLNQPGRAAPKPAETGQPTPGFADMLGDLVGDAAKATRASEMTTAKAVAGKAELVDVVTSVSAAETSLETMVAVRDRMVSAYQDVMRMQI